MSARKRSAPTGGSSGRSTPQEEVQSDSDEDENAWDEVDLNQELPPLEIATRAAPKLKDLDIVISVNGDGVKKKKYAHPRI